MNIASTSDVRNTLFAEIYAAALEYASLKIERHFGYRNQDSLIRALSGGAIDLFPGYLGIGPNGTELRDSEESLRRRAFGAILLKHSAEERTCLVTSQVSAERFYVVTLMRCASIAPRMRLAATPDFLGPHGGLAQLQSRYGGFHFKSVVVCDHGRQYSTLNNDEADVANGFSTDPEIAADQLGVLSDERNCFPGYSVAPVLRLSVSQKMPQVVHVLNRISSSLNEYAVQWLNMQCELADLPPRDVAQQFVIETSIRLPAQ